MAFLSVFLKTEMHLTQVKQLQPFYGFVDLIRDNLGEPVAGETFTHSHLSWLSVIPYLLPPSFTIHVILPVQLTYLTAFFHNLQVFLVYLFAAWHSLLHTAYISSANYCLLFAFDLHVKG